MGLGCRILPEPQRSIAAAGIGAAYAAVGTALEHPAVFVMFVNNTDAALQISLDGVNDAFPLLSGAAFVFDISSDKVAERGLFISQGTIFWVKDIGVSTTGSLYISAWYAEEK